MTIFGITFTTKRELRLELAQVKRELNTAKERIETLEEAIAEKDHNYGLLYKEVQKLNGQAQSSDNTINQLRQSNDILRTKLAKYEPKQKKGRFSNRDENGRFSKKVSNK